MLVKDYVKRSVTSFDEENDREYGKRQVTAFHMDRSLFLCLVEYGLDSVRLSMSVFCFLLFGNIIHKSR